MELMNNFMVWIFASYFVYINGAEEGCEFTSKAVICRGPNITGIPENISATTREVRIEHANIGTLDTSPLNLTQELYELYIEHSEVTDLVDNAFQGLKFLKMISLKGNNLTTLQRGLFSNLLFLKQLRLGENQLVSIDGAFEGLSSLEILSLNDNQITEISADVFKDLSSLHHLELNNNKIKEIHPQAFASMKMLMLLGLGANALTSVANIFPSDMMMLQYLNVTACQLTSFPNDLPSSLKYLKLTKNRIKHILRSDTTRYVHLNSLILEDNGLTSVEPGTFSQMTALKDLFLFVNKMDKVPSPFPASIKSIYLDNNKIASIPPDMFQNGTQLSTLSLRINNITSLSTTVFQNIESITELHLERNPISVLHDDTFKQAKGLRYLNLNRLVLSAVYPNCFSTLNSLTKLEMSFVHVPQDQVHGNIFGNLPILEELELQESPTLAKVFLTNLIIEHKKIKTIKKLNIEDNGLETLSSDIQSYLPNLKKLSLRGNNFHCNANLLWLRNWHSIEPDKFHNFNKVRCHSPLYLQGQRVQDVQIWQFYDQSGIQNQSQEISSPNLSTNKPSQIPSYDYSSQEDYIYFNYEEYDDRDLYRYDYMSHSTGKIEDIPNHSTPTTTPTSPLQQANVSVQNNGNDTYENNNIQVSKQTTEQPTKQMKSGNSWTLKTVGIAFGMAFGVILAMLIVAFLVYKVWQRKRQAMLQDGRQQNGGQDYVFISTHTDRLDRPETKVHRKMSRSERGSTTSRASEDITNQTDTDMKVYMMDVDA